MKTSLRKCSLTSKLKPLFPISFTKKPQCSSNTNFDRQCQFHGSITHSSRLSSGICVGKDPPSIVEALSCVGHSTSPCLGTQLHGHVIKLGFVSDIFIGNNLIRVYSKDRALLDAFKTFDEMPERNIVSWSLLISCASQCGEFLSGLEAFLGMTRSGLVPNEFALGSVMKICANNVEASEFGYCIHCLTLKIGMERNPFVGSSILSFYAKLGDIESAERIFMSMEKDDVGCWNAMISGYAQSGYAFEAIRIMCLMQWKGLMVDKYTFISALQGCSVMGELNVGRQIHGLIFRSEVKFCTSVMNALMDMYLKNGSLNSALNLFNKMHDRDVVTWNTIFRSVSQFQDPREVGCLFNDFMLTGLKPNHITFSVLFRQCGELLQLDLGLQFYCLALHFGFHDEANVTSSLINMFSRCGAMEMAYLVFDSAAFKNTIIWNELLSGYNSNCCDTEALKTFGNLLLLGVEADECTFSNALETCYRLQKQQMSRQIHGIAVKYGFASHGYVCSSLIKCYVKFGMLHHSFGFFNLIERPDLGCWGTMISMLVHLGHHSEAVRFFILLIKADNEPDEFILGSMLNSCADSAAYYQTKSIHPLVMKLGFERHLFVASALIDAYAKCGDIRSARGAFNESFKSNDVIIYNAMIIAYAHHGLVAEAMGTFYAMKLANIQPNQATFVSVISACGHIGLVDQAWHLFYSMDKEYGLKPSPENYGCLVDALSRNGYLVDAKHTIEVMPYHPWPAILRSLLNGCRIHENIELGEWAAKKLLQLIPNDNAVYALLFKIFAERGCWEDAVMVRKGVTDNGLRKDPGYSFVETS